MSTARRPIRSLPRPVYVQYDFAGAVPDATYPNVILPIFVDAGNEWRGKDGKFVGWVDDWNMIHVPSFVGAMQKRPPSTVVALDIETWQIEATGKPDFNWNLYASQTANIVDAVTQAVAVRPDLRFAMYDIMPLRNYFAAVKYRTGMAEFAKMVAGQPYNAHDLDYTYRWNPKANQWEISSECEGTSEYRTWQRNNDLTAFGQNASAGTGDLLDRMDFLCPSIYQFYAFDPAAPSAVVSDNTSTTAVRWYLEEMFSEAFRIGQFRPLVPLLSASIITAGRKMTKVEATHIFNVCANYVHPATKQKLSGLGLWYPKFPEDQWMVDLARSIFGASNPGA